MAGIFDLLAGYQPAQFPGAQVPATQQGLLGKLQAGPFGGKITNWLQQNPMTALALGMGLLSGGSTSDAFGKGLQGLLGGSQYDQERAQKKLQEEALGEWGGQGALPPKMYKAFPQQAATAAFAGGVDATSDDIREYNFAKSQGYTGTFLDFMTKVKGATGAQESFYGTPIFGQNPEGDIAGAYIYSNRGTVKPLDLSGMTPTAAGQQAADGSTGGPVTVRVPGSAKTVNLGTSQAVVDPSGRVIDKLPIDVAGAAAQGAVGTAAGAAQINLPTVENAARRIQEGIDSIINDPATSQVVGRYQVGPVGVPKNVMPALNDEMARARSNIEYVLGNVFLTAYNDLRGAGQITEREGQAAQAAYTRLKNTELGDQDFLKAARDLKVEIDKLVGVARQKAAMGGEGQEAQQPGTITLPDGTIMRQVR